MPRKTSPESLETVVRAQDADTLADVLLELAASHDAVRKRLERLALAKDPKALASAFRKTLSGWKRSSRFLMYAEARAFGLELESWLGQVERELLSADPARALELVEDFIAADEKWFNRADDSDGVIGGAVRAGCRLWLRCAAACETPASEWPDRIARLVDDDGYGAREVLLREAGALLDEAALHSLVQRYETQLDRLVVEAQRSGARTIPTSVFQPASALSALAEALHDPDVAIRATLRYSPEPNELQRENFVRKYMEAGRPADALKWLQAPWGRMEDSRLRWQATALNALGRTGEAASLREQVLERTRAVSDLEAWLALLPPAAHASAIERARAWARQESDPETAARLLLAAGDDEAAQATVLEHADGLDGRRYDTLRALAEAFEARGCPAGAIAAYRALMLAILERAYTPAYGHAARYWRMLGELAAAGADLAPLPSTAAFETEVRQRHGRKSSFWALVDKQMG